MNKSEIKVKTGLQYSMSSKFQTHTHLPALLLHRRHPDNPNSDFIVFPKTSSICITGVCSIVCVRM